MGRHVTREVVVRCAHRLDAGGRSERHRQRIDGQLTPVKYRSLTLEETSGLVMEILTPAQQAGVGLLGMVQIGLLIAAQVDLSKRRVDQLNGPKTLWRLLSFVNFIK